MSTDAKVFVPNRPFQAGPEWGVMSTKETGVHHLPAGQRIHPLFEPLLTDITLHKNVLLALRDTTKIYVDIYLPAATSGKIPALVAWSPYGKTGGTSPNMIGLFKMLGINPHTSGLEKFEGPDPSFWCSKGFAVCNPDPRGIGESEGDAVMFGRQEGQDCHDLIEWLAVRDWCNGKVGMSGTSYLAAAQWVTAAEQPPHLAAISPCEGFSDIYRELAKVGGMDDLAFVRRVETAFAGPGRRESNAEEAVKYPLFNDFWKDKLVDMSRITVPAYVVASYTNALHTPGTFRGWRGISSKQKWLRIHDTMEWPDYYKETSKERLLKFFDHFLKGIDNGWIDTPTVEYTVQDLEGHDRTDISAASFPPANVTAQKLYLRGDIRSFVPEPPKEDVKVTYSSEAWPGMVSFIKTFDEDTTIVGYPRLRLYVEVVGGDDMDLFFLIQKLDRQGNYLQQFNVPGRSAGLHDVTERGAPVIRYKGPHARLRVSVGRHLDPELSTEEIPVHGFNKEENLKAGEIVPIDIAVSPCGLVFYAGEQLRLVVSSRNIHGPLMPDPIDFVPKNQGSHVIHAGGGYASYLVLPTLGEQ